MLAAGRVFAAAPVTGIATNLRLRFRGQGCGRFARKTAHVYVATAPRPIGGHNGLPRPAAAGPAAKLVGNIEIFAGQRWRTHLAKAPVGALFARLTAALETGLVGGEQLGDVLRVHLAGLEEGIVRAALQVLNLHLHEGEDGGFEVVELLIFAEDEVEDGQVNRID